MAYNGFINPYQSYYQPYPAQQNNNPVIQTSGFVSVRNEAEARNYPVGSYRNIRRDRMGRYSSGRDKAKEELITGLRELGRDSSDEETKMMVKKWIKQLEQD